MSIKERVKCGLARLCDELRWRLIIKAILKACP
jgi:hypothetical protein